MTPLASLLIFLAGLAFGGAAGLVLGWLLRTFLRDGYREARRPMGAARPMNLVRSPRVAGTRRWR